MQALINKGRSILPSFTGLTTKNPISDSKRVDHAFLKYQLCLNDTARPIFERLYIFYSDSIFSSFLFQCNFQSILTLRLVAKTLCQFVSTINNSFSCSPLSDKATIAFDHHDDFLPTLKLGHKEKCSFAIDNTNADITISIDELNSPSSIFESIPKEKLNLIIKISNLDELNECRLFIKKNEQSINKIKGLDLSFLTINGNTIDSIIYLLFTVSHNPILCTKLTKLSLGEIEENVTFTFPNLILNLKVLALRSIKDNATFDLSNHLTSNFEKLSFGPMDIGENAKLILPKDLSNLTMLSFNGYYPLSMNLSNNFLKITKLSLGDIKVKVSLDLNNYSMPNLTELSFGDIYGVIKMNLGKDLSKITKLSFGDLKMNGSFELTNDSLPNLRELTFGIINSYSTLKLSNCELPNLAELYIKDISDHSSVILPNELPNLAVLFLGGIYKTASLILPKSLSNLRRLECGKDDRHFMQSTPLYYHRYLLSLTRCLPLSVCNKLIPGVVAFIKLSYVMFVVLGVAVLVLSSERNTVNYASVFGLICLHSRAMGLVEYIALTIIALSYLYKSFS